MVSFLVTEEGVNMPVIGYNVIEEIVNKPNIVNMIEAALRDVSKKKVELLVKLIQKKVSSAEPESIGDVKVGSKDKVMPKGRNLKMKCVTHCSLDYKVNRGMPILLWNVCNDGRCMPNIDTL